MSNTYISKADLVTIFAEFGITIVENDISDTMLYSAKQMLDSRVEKSWDVNTDVSYYLDGKGNNSVYAPVLPIVALTEVTVINEDTTETTYTLTGTSRQIWWDENTGKIEIIQREDDITVGDMDQYDKFPEGVRNVKITGTFGETAPELVQLAQALILYRIYSLSNPSKYKTDIISEKISKYTYQKAGYSGSNTISFDKYLDGIIKDIRGADSLYMESV